MNRSLYFGKPAAWSKLARPEQEHKDMQLNKQANFHARALAQVKRGLGSSCTFLAHFVTGEESGFIAYMVIKGQKQKVSVVEGVPNVGDLTAEHYKKLKDTLYEHTRS